MSDVRSQRQRSGVGVKLFGRTWMLTGWSAGALAVIVIGVAVALLAYLASQNPSLALSAVLWIVMMVYWSVAAKRSAPVKSAEPPQSRARHQLLLNVALLFAFVRLPFLGARWLPVSPLVAPFGLAVQIGAMALDVWAMHCLGRNWSGAIAIKEDHQLVRTGPYRILRHPIYTAMIGMYLGTAIVSGELHGLVAVLLCVIAYARKTIMEERGLREAFGAAYDEYARGTSRLIPWVF